MESHDDGSKGEGMAGKSKADELIDHLQHSQADTTKAGKHDELLAGMTNDDRGETLDALGTICNSIHVDNPIVQFVDIITKSTSYAGAEGARAKDQLKADLVDVITIGIPSLTGDDFTKETIHVEYEWRPLRCDECKSFSHVHDHCPKKVVNPPIVTTSNVAAPTVEKFNDDFQTVGKKKKRKGKFKSTNGGQFVGSSVKQTLRYEPKANTSTPKKGAINVSNLSKSSSMLKIADTFSKKDNFTTSNSFYALNDEEEDDEEVENVYDESANLYPHTKTGGSSSFTAAAG
nr:zinc knuckle CX2CX4HX4C [Tanacetum cinerariifolium]